MNEQEHIKSELLSEVHRLFEDDIPFHRLLGLHIDKIDFEEVIISIQMKDEFTGNPVHRSLHGGVVSSLIDVTGGLIAFLGIQNNTEKGDLSSRLQQLGKLGTIDLRVDYLLPGKSDSFKAVGRCLRVGSKIAVTRMEVFDSENKKVALGTGTYNVS